MKIRNWKVVIQAAVLLVGLCQVSMVQAADSASHKLDRKVVLACEKSLGIPAREMNPSQQQIALIHTCLKEYRVSLHNCAQQSGVNLAASPTAAAETPSYRACEAQAFSAIH